jgi:hypothetical protein
MLALCYKPEGYVLHFRYVIGIFNGPNLSSRTMTLGSTQPLTEMSTRNLPSGKAENLTAICEQTVKCGRLDLS